MRIRRTIRARNNGIRGFGLTSATAAIEDRPLLGSGIATPNGKKWGGSRLPGLVCALDQADDRRGDESDIDAGVSHSKTPLDPRAKNSRKIGALIDA